ncbi:YkuS family protein [Alkalihalobacillus sp. MEB130]|uniref:YkuS family protein n=1 Tax=Alkalihalobacillus sp. MEB130 TaxID=2976704 RepID=UPI0028DF157E|nr:YkuS family protein [Alkalihalobacillus sp. MEB130]MDT8859202.1 YkuS family protein [Alkalihalobacillus sp. MEB130]
MPKIGVEQSLTDVQQELQSKGYDVVQLKQEQDAQGCDCCVITGQDQNVMGIQDAAIQGSVINAHGMTAQQVCQVVEEKMGHQQ